jgi:hypothetical protein
MINRKVQEVKKGKSNCRRESKGRRRKDNNMRESLLCTEGSQEKRCCWCDIDPQGNCTSGMGVDKNAASPNLYNVLVDGVQADKAVMKTKYGDVLPSNAIVGRRY